MEIIPVRTWKEALAKSGTVATSNAWMEGRALLTRELGRNHRMEYRRWNDRVADAHEAFQSSIFPQVDAAIAAIPEVAAIDNGPGFLQNHMQWDLVAAYMEAVYSHLVSPRFNTLMLTVYSAGHFPCGWDEVWPNGKLWVY